MKKLLLVPALLLSGMCSYAQISLMPEVGGHLSNLSSQQSFGGGDYTLTGNMRPGLRAGVAINVPLAGHIGIQPGIYYSYSSTEMEWSILGMNVSSTINLHAIQIPVYAMYYGNSEVKGGFFAGVGPFLNYYLSGTKTGDWSLGRLTTTIATNRNISFGDDPQENDMHAFDYGGSATAGYILSSGLSLRAYFNFGLANLAAGGDSDNRLKGKSVGISIGYIL